MFYKSPGQDGAVGALVTAGESVALRVALKVIVGLKLLHDTAAPLGERDGSGEAREGSSRPGG